MNSVLYCYRCPTRYLRIASCAALVLTGVVLAGLLHAPSRMEGIGWVPPVVVVLGLAAGLAIVTAMIGRAREDADALMVTETHIRWQRGWLRRRGGVIRLAEVRAVYAELNHGRGGAPDRLALATDNGEVVRVPDRCLRRSARPIVNLLREAHPYLVFVVAEKK